MNESVPKDTPRPLRIAQMLESDGPGGAEMVMLRLAECLRDRGHEVVPVGPATGCGWLAERFRERGFAPEQFLLRSPIDWRCARDLQATLARRRVDVVHSHEFTMAIYGAACAWWLERPHVITMHGNQTMTARWRRRVTLRAAFARSAAVAAVSRDTKRHLDAELGLGAETVAVVRNGVPIPSGSRDRLRSELGVSADEVLVAAVGSLVARKGHAVLLQALAMQPATSRWRAVIAGNGPERAALEHLASDLGITQRVALLGHRDDVGDVLAAADVFVMPSLWEGLPLALLEAMRAGKPVIASATSGIPEAIDDGSDGLLVPPGDRDTLARTLSRVCADAALRTTLGQRAAARATHDFSVEAMTTAYENLYRRGLAERGPAQAPAVGYLSRA